MTNLCKSVSPVFLKRKEKGVGNVNCASTVVSQAIAICPHKSQAAPRVNIEHFSLLSNKSLTLPIILRTDTFS